MFADRRAHLIQRRRRRCASTASPVDADDRNHHLVFTRRQAAKLESVRLGCAIAFERNHARTIEFGRICDNFDRAIVGVGLDGRLDDQVRRGVRDCGRHANRKRFLRAGDGRRNKRQSKHQTSSSHRIFPSHHATALPCRSSLQRLIPTRATAFSLPSRAGASARRNHRLVIVVAITHVCGFEQVRRFENRAAWMLNRRNGSRTRPSPTE